MGYWLEQRLAFGPIEYRFEGETPNFRWYFSTVSKSWLGASFELTPEKPIKIKGIRLRKGVTPEKADKTIIEDQEQLKNTISDYFLEIEKNDLFSGQVLISKGNEILFHGSYGWANIESGKKLTLDTPLNLASTGKMFTAVGIGQLIDKGYISLQDPIVKFILEYPKHIAEKVTIEHLLTHTSGIELDHIEEFNDMVHQAKSVQDIIDAQLIYITELENYDSFEPKNSFD